MIGRVVDNKGNSTKRTEHFSRQRTMASLLASQECLTMK